MYKYKLLLRLRVTVYRYSTRGWTVSYRVHTSSESSLSIAQIVLHTIL